MPKSEQTLKVVSGGSVAISYKEMPDHRINTLARQTLHAVERFFSLPGVKEDYEKWLEEYEKEMEAKNNASTDNLRSGGSGAAGRGNVLRGQTDRV